MSFFQSVTCRNTLLIDSQKLLVQSLFFLWFICGWTTEFNSAFWVYFRSRLGRWVALGTSLCISNCSLFLRNQMLYQHWRFLRLQIDHEQSCFVGLFIVAPTLFSRCLITFCFKWRVQRNRGEIGNATANAFVIAFSSSQPTTIHQWEKRCLHFSQILRVLPVQSSRKYCTFRMNCCSVAS